MVLKAIFTLAVFTFTFQAHADFQWSGTYRAEAYHINNSELDGKDRKKEYGLHHLILKPKLVAADGLNIQGRLDILNSSAYPDSALGEFFGGDNGCSASVENNCTTGQNQEAEMINITQLYLTYIHEFGSLLVGRAPVQFGLGMTHNAGEGLFDHWMDNRDMVAYKVAVGNLSIIPMYGKLNEGTISDNKEDITDLMLQLDYENLESGVEYGLLYWVRKGGSDTSLVAIPAGATAGQDYEVTTINAFFAKETQKFRFGLEASMQSGDAGSTNGSGQQTEVSGFAAVAEVDYNPSDSDWKYSLGLGYVTGDDASTDDEYEGFIVDRNYDVAFLMFNHQLGQFDALRTGIQNSYSVPHDSPDIESISNAYYLDLNTEYKWNEKWSLGGGLTYASLVEDNGNDSALGFEVDLSITFSPNKKLKWVNEVGLLFPGSAFENDGTTAYDSEFAYGLATKAAISF